MCKSSFQSDPSSELDSGSELLRDLLRVHQDGRVDSSERRGGERDDLVTDKEDGAGAKGSGRRGGMRQRRCWRPRRWTR